MTQLPKPVSFGLIAFLASWQATEFSLNYRSVVGAIVAGLMGFLNPELGQNTADTQANITKLQN